MPYIPGTKQLIRKVKDLQAIAEQVEDRVTDKRGWLDRQDAKYLESPQGLEWQDYLERLEYLLMEVMDIDTEGV